MVDYLDSVIAEHIDSCKNDGRPSEIDFENDQEYTDSLHDYGDAIA
jgi:hypothetical protein